jgi:hypothetical protein
VNFRTVLQRNFQKEISSWEIRLKIDLTRKKVRGKIGPLCSAVGLRQQRPVLNTKLCFRTRKAQCELGCFVTETLFAKFKQNLHIVRADEVFCYFKFSDTSRA